VDQTGPMSLIPTYKSSVTGRMLYDKSILVRLWLSKCLRVFITYVDSCTH
jgi:hypothetical protein